MTDDLIERLDKRAIVEACEDPCLEDVNGAAAKTLYGEAATALRTKSERIQCLETALREIAFLRPGGPCRGKLVGQMERIAIDAIAKADSQS